MNFERRKHNGIYTAVNDKYIFTLINVSHSKYNAYFSGKGMFDKNILIAENVGYNEAVRACENVK